LISGVTISFFRSTLPHGAIIQTSKRAYLYEAFFYKSIIFRYLYTFLRTDKIGFRASFETSTAVIFQVEVFWDVKPCCVVVGYQRFRAPCCLHLKGQVAGTEENGTDNRQEVEEDGRCRWPIGNSEEVIRQPLLLHPLHPEDGGSLDLRNVGILPQHYTASQPRRPRLEIGLKLNGTI
jgi:hypothetical protein